MTTGTPTSSRRKKNTKVPQSPFRVNQAWKGLSCAAIAQVRKIRQENPSQKTAMIEDSNGEQRRIYTLQDFTPTEPTETTPLGLKRNGLPTLPNDEPNMLLQAAMKIFGTVANLRCILLEHGEGYVINEILTWYDIDNNSLKNFAQGMMIDAVTDPEVMLDAAIKCFGSLESTLAVLHSSSNGEELIVNAILKTHDFDTDAIKKFIRNISQDNFDFANIRNDGAATAAGGRSISTTHTSSCGIVRSSNIRNDGAATAAGGRSISTNHTSSCGILGSSSNDNNNNNNQPDVLGQLAGFIGSNARHIGDLTDTVGDLTDTVGDLADKHGKLADTVGDLADNQRDLAVKFGDLADHQRDLGVKVGDLTTNVGDLADTVETVAETTRNQGNRLHDVEGVVSNVQETVAELVQSVKKDRMKLQDHEDNLAALQQALFGDTEDVEDGDDEDAGEVEAGDAQDAEEEDDGDEEDEEVIEGDEEVEDEDIIELHPDAIDHAAFNQYRSEDEAEREALFGGGDDDDVAASSATNRSAKRSAGECGLRDRDGKNMKWSEGVDHGQEEEEEEENEEGFEENGLDPIVEGQEEEIDECLEEIVEGEEEEEAEETEEVEEEEMEEVEKEETEEVEKEENETKPAAAASRSWLPTLWR